MQTPLHDEGPLILWVLHFYELSNRDAMTSGYDPDFASVAEYYSGRIPYLPGFFAKAVEYFGISKNSTVLELGCGTAELSLGFSPYCKSVLAIDKSPEMVSHRRETPDNVRFLLADLNAEIGTLPVQADLVAIGRAIYFFDKEKVAPLLNAVTAASAAIFICGAVISRRTPWLAQYETLRKRYRTRNVPLDIYGEAFLRLLGGRGDRRWW